MPRNKPSTPVNDDDEACQLDMFSSLTGSADDRWDKILTEIRLAVDDIGPKEVCYDNGLTASQLSHALAERDRHFPASLLVYLIPRSRKHGTRIAAFLAGLGGFKLSVPKTLTPEEELAELKESLARNLSPEMRRVVMRDTSGAGR